MRVNDLVPLFTGLTEIEAAVTDHPAAAGLDELVVYPGRPLSINLPAIYHVLEPSQMEPADTVTDRDTIIIGARVAVRHSDAPEEFMALLAYADAFRHTVDPALKSRTGPLGGAFVRRLGMHLVGDMFNQVPVLAIEFPIRAYLEAANPPS